MAERDPRYFKVYQDGDDRELEQKIQQIVESGAAPGIDVQARDSIEEIQRKIDSGEIGGGGGGGAGVDTKAREDIQKVSTQLAHTANSFYEPPKQRAGNGSEGFTVENLRATDIYALYDTLMAKYPNAIEKRTLGKDQSGTYDIYRYDFFRNSQGGKKKIIVGANLHGPGPTGDPKSVAYTLYKFFELLCEQYQTNDKLFHMRFNMHFIVLPIQNPWGFDNGKRQNSRGVDLNRNFDIAWDAYTGGTNPFDHDYKGPAPFSEVESQYVRDVLNGNASAIAYIDFHAYNTANSTEFSWIYSGWKSSPMLGVSEVIAKYLGGKERYVTYDLIPQGCMYAEYTYGIPSCTPEFATYAPEKTPFTSQMMTDHLRWYANWIWACVDGRIQKSATSVSNEIYRSMVQSTNSEVIPSSNGNLKKMVEQYTTKPFNFNPDTCTFTVPNGVTHIRMSAQLRLFFDSATEERMRLSFFIQKNGAVNSGYPSTRTVATLGGSVNAFKEQSLAVVSPILGCKAGDTFRLIVETSHTGGLLSTYSSALQGCWFTIEQVKLG